MSRKKPASVLVATLALFLSAGLQAQSPASPRDALKRNVEKFQSNPNDKALRETIISQAARLKPAPAAPEEARRHFVKGVTLQKDAVSVSDYELAVDAYKRALSIAPWWPEAYFNLAAAQEGAGKYAEAMDSLNLYLLSKPADARQAQDKLYALEAKAERAQAAKREEAKKPTFEGVWMMYVNGQAANSKLRIEKYGDDWMVTEHYDTSYSVRAKNAEVDGQRIRFQTSWGPDNSDLITNQYELLLSNDGKSLEGRQETLPQTSQQIRSMQERGIVDIPPTSYSMSYRRDN